MSINSPLKGGITAVKIMYVVEAFPRVSEVFIAREIQALERLGLDVDVLSLSIPSFDSVKHSINDELRCIIRYLNENQSDRWDKALRHFSLFRSQTADYLKLAKESIRLDLAPNTSYLFRQLPIFCTLFRSSGAVRLHAHFGWTGLVAAWMMASYLKVPYSVTLHGSDVLVSPYPSIGAVLRGAQHVICVSETIRKVVTGWGVEDRKTEVIHCGIDPTLFHPPAAPPSELRILSVARLHSIKSLKHLVEACALLRARGVPFVCTLVGDGPERDDLHRRVEAAGVVDSVRLTGSLPNESLPEVYASHSVFVLPSFSEGLPVVLMEAMASGLPVVATRVGGVPEIVGDPLNGRLVEPGRPDHLADAILQLHHLDPTEKAVMALRNRKRIIEEFNIQNESAKLLKIFSPTS